MNRRIFLTRTSAAVSTSLLMPHYLLASHFSAKEAVEQVHVIFKTHLDVGFTDMAATVIKTYSEEFIPNVLSLTERIAAEGSKDRYKWTTGSWLVYRYLEGASPENSRRMERAIERGDLIWHGLPFTTHTELMDQSLFKLATSYSAELDRRFGRKTLAAKMTDVPGHTRGMLPVMADAGVELFHIGVNTGSYMPEVPALFTWEDPAGKKLTVMYHHAYGGVALLPGEKIAVSINFTGDNRGPHTPEQIEAIYANLREQFPNANVFASDLNAVAKEMRVLRDVLPVVTREIGDTWIHGTGSDPLLMARFRELSRLRKEWIQKGKLEANGEADMAFGNHLLCIPEHTWGLTIRSLKHWDIYNMPKFQASRELPEFREMEASWAEKRANIDRAVASLPVNLKSEAGVRLKSLHPERPEPGELKPVDPAKDTFKTKFFRVGFDPKTGAVNLLEDNRTGRCWATTSHPLGLFSYQTFSPSDFGRFMKQYVPGNLLREEWVINSFNKPGLENSSAQSALYFTTLKQLWFGRRKDGDFFMAQMEIPESADSGCPQEIYVETFLPDNDPVVKTTLKWFGKPASRLPEACWFSFVPSVLSDGSFLMDKMGQQISPLDVVRGGNRNLHGVIDGISYKDSKSLFELETPDAFLVAPGKRTLLEFDQLQPDMTGGFHVCLYNNVWGTNFTMWFEDDMQFRFSMRFG